MLLSEQRLPLQVTTARQLPSPGYLPPTSLLSRFLFRPPRLS
jgi:hypothetical protein